MALRAMPFVIVNLGGEMIYILEQRLRAQSIPPEKAVKVLHDVVKTMFSTKFIAEVPSPEPLSEQSLRALDLGDRLWGLHGPRPARVSCRAVTGAKPLHPHPHNETRLRLVRTTPLPLRGASVGILLASPHTKQRLEKL